MGFTLDATKFMANLSRIETGVIELARKGMGQALLSCQSDTIKVVPTVPWKTGHLRASCAVFINNKLTATTAKGSLGTPATSLEEEIPFGSIIGIIGFNTPYAAEVHEVPKNFKNTGSGNKYLELKLSMFHQKYYNIMAKVIRDGMGRT